MRDRQSAHDDVYPEIPDLRGVKVGVSGDPFRAESHPPTQTIVMGGFKVQASRTIPSIEFSGG